MLSPDEYYRPTRAQELRRKAERLEAWSARLSTPRYRIPITVALVVASILLVVLLARRTGGAFFIFFLFAPLLELVRGALTGRAAAYRREAIELEREHAARYGSLAPPSQTPLESTAPAEEYQTTLRQ